MGNKGTARMNTSRDRRERRPLALDPQGQACRAGQPTLSARDPKPRWRIRLGEPVNVVRDGRACGTPACAQRAVVYRPPPEDP
jgi:hypothetical protein